MMPDEGGHDACKPRPGILALIDRNGRKAPTDPTVVPADGQTR